MKYEKHIYNAFNRIGFVPRDNQVDAVNQIVSAYLDEDVEDVILSAPTGSGKSIIAVAASEVLRDATEWYNTTTSVISMGTNALAKQYHDTFKGNPNFLAIKGANNYDCGVTQDTAESCALNQLKMQKMNDIMDQHCSSCEYQLIKARKDSTRHLITNYSYVFVERMYVRRMSERLIYVWDEAHTLNDAFTEHNAIFVSVDRLTKIIEELASVLTSNVEVFNKLKKVKSDLEKGNFNEDTYELYLHQLLDIYTLATGEFERLMFGCIKKGMKNFDIYTRYSRLYKKYFGLGCKIDDLFKFNYEHIIDHKEEQKEISVKPIFVGNMFKVLRNSKYSLFMSATLNPKFMISTLGLDPNKTKYIHLTSSFPPESKKVIFYSPLALSYKTMNDSEVVENLLTKNANIFKKHDKLDERGVYLMPSFALTEKIANKLRKEKCNTKIFEHIKGTKLIDILSEFKNYEGKAILLSPSIFEGIDLPDAQSRYQVLVKAPFPSLADKRMAYILKRHPQVYECITLMKIVQGIGRSVRSSEDYAITYVLDTNIKRLFTSELNVWKEEFSVSFSNFL